MHRIPVLLAASTLQRSIAVRTAGTLSLTSTCESGWVAPECRKYFVYHADVTTVLTDRLRRWRNILSRTLAAVLLRTSPPTGSSWPRHVGACCGDHPQKLTVYAVDPVSSIQFM